MTISDSAGYAVASTDTGHTTADASFAIGHPEKLVDFGYRAVHETAEKAKSLTDRSQLSTHYGSMCRGASKVSGIECVLR